jgi:hypothetical protein
MRSLGDQVRDAVNAVADSARGDVVRLPEYLDLRRLAASLSDAGAEQLRRLLR